MTACSRTRRPEQTQTLARKALASYCEWRAAHLLIILSSTRFIAPLLAAGWTLTRYEPIQFRISLTNPVRMVTSLQLSIPTSPEISLTAIPSASTWCLIRKTLQKILDRHFREQAESFPYLAWDLTPLFTKQSFRRYSSVACCVAKVGGT